MEEGRNPGNYINKTIMNIKYLWNNYEIKLITMEGRSAFKILTGKLTGKRPLGRPRSRWEDNITMDLKEMDINKRCSG